jgi:hypothetical protein
MTVVRPEPSPYDWPASEVLKHPELPSLRVGHRDRLAPLDQLLVEDKVQPLTLLRIDAPAVLGRPVLRELERRHVSHADLFPGYEGAAHFAVGEIGD